MAEVTQEEIDNAIQNCMWRQSFLGIDICSGNCAPCSHEIDNGRCDKLRRLFADKNKEETINHD